MKHKKYAFVDYNGNPRGLENVDDLIEAVCIAIEFQCEVIDIITENEIVFSVWEGWNYDYTFYDPKTMQNFTREVIENRR